MLRHKIPVILAKKETVPSPPTPASRSRYEQQQNITRSILRLKKATLECTFMGVTFFCLEIVKM